MSRRERALTARPPGAVAGRRSMRRRLYDIRRPRREERRARMTVEEVMTRTVITVDSATSIHEAARLMVEHGVSGLPVVEHGQLVGIISDGDLILRQK